MCGTVYNGNILWLVVFFKETFQSVFRNLDDVIGKASFAVLPGHGDVMCNVACPDDVHCGQVHREEDLHTTSVLALVELPSSGLVMDLELHVLLWGEMRHV